MIKSLLTFLSILLLTFSLYAQEVKVSWVKRYNGPGNGGENALAIKVDSSGNVYVAGYSPGNGTSADYATIKYYPDGETAWERRYNGPASGYDAARALAVDGTGNVYVTGGSPGKETSDDYATIKYDPKGKELWIRRYDGPYSKGDRAYAIAVDKDKNVYVSGTSGMSLNKDYATIKYDKKGKERWLQRYNGPGNGNDQANALSLDPFGNICVTGISLGNSNDYLTIKYDSKGNELWVKRYNGPADGEDEATALKTDLSGNICVTGGSDGKGTGRDYLTIKYDPEGEIIWERRYGGAGTEFDQARALSVDAPGNVYVTGESYNRGTGLDYLTIKYYPNGDTAWVRRYNGPADGNDYAKAMVVDNSGGVYVTGYSPGKGSSYDYTTIKYDSEGGIAWVKRYDGTAKQIDWAQDIAIDAFNNVYVTGRSEGRGSAYDFVTIKYVQLPASR